MVLFPKRNSAGFGGRFTDVLAVQHLCMVLTDPGVDW